MAYKDTAKKTAYQNEFIKNAYDRINLTVPKGRKEEIATAAAASGESVNAYINRAITAQMQREAATGGQSSGDSPIQVHRDITPVQPQGDAPGTVSIFSDGGDKPQAAVAVSPTQDDDLDDDIF